MIDWELLYNKLLVDKESMSGDKHHSIPKHDGGINSNIIRLERRYHILAHYIRYRWKNQLGDALACKILGKTIFITRKQLSLLAIDTWKNPTIRKARITGRALWINTLEDKKTLTKHMLTDKCKTKKTISYRNYIESNPDKIQKRVQKTANTNKAQNQNLTELELSLKYGRGSGINNPKWRGYLVLESKIGDKQVFDSIQEGVQKTGLTIWMVRAYMNTDIALKKGSFKDYKILLTKTP
jgi:hypothetical protein